MTKPVPLGFASEYSPAAAELQAREDIRIKVYGTWACSGFRTLSESCDNTRLMARIAG
jgi:hypothetical protein